MNYKPRKVKFEETFEAESGSEVTVKVTAVVTPDQKQTQTDPFIEGDVEIYSHELTDRDGKIWTVRDLSRHTGKSENHIMDILVQSAIDYEHDLHNREADAESALAEDRTEGKRKGH